MSFVGNELQTASTIPSEWYRQTSFLEKDYHLIFNRTWQLVGNSRQLQNAGDYFTTKLGRENIVVLKNEKLELKAFVNVCRHRAGSVAKGSGNCSTLKCQYHGWTYDLNGKLRTTPEFQGVENFDPSQNGLPSVEVRTYGPLLFAALNPSMTFEEFLGEIPSELAHLHLEEMKFCSSMLFHVQANWKVYVDNYLEGYHIPMVHPDLCQELDYKQYRTDTFKWYSKQFAPAKAQARYYNEGENPEAHYYWLFPNLMFNIYQGIFQTNTVLPDGPERCTVRFDWFSKTSLSKERLAELMRFSDQIQAEDAEICAQVQENLHSVTYKQGRFSVKRENGVHHFHLLLEGLINAAEKI